MAGLGVLARITQAASAERVAEQNFRSSLFAQGRAEILEGRKVRLAESEAISNRIERGIDREDKRKRDIELDKLERAKMESREKIAGLSGSETKQRLAIKDAISLDLKARAIEGDYQDRVDSFNLRKSAGLSVGQPPEKPNTEILTGGANQIRANAGLPVAASPSSNQIQAQAPIRELSSGPLPSGDLSLNPVSAPPPLVGRGAEIGDPNEFTRINQAQGLPEDSSNASPALFPAQPTSLVNAPPPAIPKTKEEEVQSKVTPVGNSPTVQTNPFAVAYSPKRSPQDTRILEQGMLATQPKTIDEYNGRKYYIGTINKRIKNLESIAFLDKTQEGKDAISAEIAQLEGRAENLKANLPLESSLKDKGLSKITSQEILILDKIREFYANGRVGKLPFGDGDVGEIAAMRFIFGLGAEGMFSDMLPKMPKAFRAAFGEQGQGQGGVEKSDKDEDATLTPRTLFGSEASTQKYLR